MSDLFTINLLPSMVFVDSKTDIKFVAQNNSDTEPISIKVGRGGDSISIEFPKGNSEADLVSNLNFNADVQNDDLVCNLVGSQFVVTATQDTQIAGGEALTIIFEKMPINTTQGDATVTTSYYIGDDFNTYHNKVDKKPQELGVIAWADPLIIGLNQTTFLQFKSVASTSVVISGYPDGVGEKKFETPPYSGGDHVGVGSQTESQRNYTVTAWADGKQSTPVIVAVSQNPPIINEYSPTGVSEVEPDEALLLSWRSQFADGNTLQWLNTDKQNVQSPFQVIPGEDLTNVYNTGNNNAQFMPDCVVYTLTINGFKKPEIQTFEAKVKPVQLQYLKYKNSDLTEIIYDYTPLSWAAVDRSFGNNSMQLTVYQPGYQKDEFYLSTDDAVNPMIQFFEAESGQLNWITANLASLTLELLCPAQPSISIDQSDIANGSHIIPAGAGVVALTGVGNNGKSIRSELTLN